RLGCGVRVLPRELASVRPKRRLELDYNIAAVLFHKVSNELEDVLRVLIGHEPATDLGLRSIRHDRLHAGSLIAAGYAVNFKSRLGHYRFQNAFGVVETKLLQFVRRLELFSGK